MIIIMPIQCYKERCTQNLILCVHAHIYAHAQSYKAGVARDEGRGRMVRGQVPGMVNRCCAWKRQESTPKGDVTPLPWTRVNTGINFIRLSTNP
jgi:hypothetical protein